MSKRLFVLGAIGRLGNAAVKFWQDSSEYRLILLRRTDLDLSNPQIAYEQLASHSLAPGDCILNAAAWTDVDACENNPQQADRINAIAPGKLAALATQAGARFLQISTDYVFSGEKKDLYTEADLPYPQTHYGRSKLAGEEAVLNVATEASAHVVARVSWLFGSGRPSFLDQIIKEALLKNKVAAIADKFSSPTYTYDLVKWLAYFLQEDAPGGLFHLCNSGSCSWQEYATWGLTVAERMQLPLLARKVTPLKLEEMTSFIASRPRYSSLSTEKFQYFYGITPRSWQEAVEEYMISCYQS